MKGQISPPVATVIIIVALLVLIGIGYAWMNSDQVHYKRGPVVMPPGIPTGPNGPMGAGGNGPAGAIKMPPGKS